MYFDLYNLLSEFIYGSGAELTEWMDLTLTMLSTFAVLVVVCVPFLLVIIFVALLFFLVSRWFS